MPPINRRNFIKGAAALGAASSLLGCTGLKVNSGIESANKSVASLAIPKLEQVRAAFIGVGQRGAWHVKTLASLDGVEITAVCDIDEQSLQASLQLLADSGRNTPAAYGSSEHDYKNMLQRDDIDIVIISTPWRWHATMCVEAMEAGKHAFVEVPATMSLDESWQLVETAEKTGRHCMMLENVCYGRDELMVLNMLQQGLFGEITHGEAAYIHELRWQMKEVDRKTGSWRTDWHTKRRGNLYPTHGLGPIAQYMNINRGDRFDYLTAMDSPALGRALYAEQNFDSQHKRNQASYITGDMNTCIIKTVRGKTIMVQHDTTTPRPYSRHNLIQGTKGAFAGFPNRIAIEGQGNFHKWDYEMEKWYAKYDHPLWKQLQQEAEANNGHGGMDFVMMWRIIYCLRNGLPLDQNVYDGVSWSAINFLTHESVSNRSKVVDIPDFTRGAWKTEPAFNLA